MKRVISTLVILLLVCVNTIAQSIRVAAFAQETIGIKACIVLKPVDYL